MLFPGPEPTSETVTTLFEGEGNLMDVDSATSPSASRRMTEWGGILRRVKVLGIEKLIIERNQTY